MGFLNVLNESVQDTFLNQWKEIITVEQFDEHTVAMPGEIKSIKQGKNTTGTIGIISNGSKIFVPENTAALIFSKNGIENVITTPGGYEYKNGEPNIFSKNGAISVLKSIGERFAHGGTSPQQKEVVFINLREIRDIKFGTRGPQVYNDIFYGCDLEIFAYGSFSVKITDIETFAKNFLPANVTHYSFDDKIARSQVVSDFLQSFIVALNLLSNQYRISQLPSQANALSLAISKDTQNAGSWKERFGFEIIKVSIENIEFSPQSRELVNTYNHNKMSVRAYEGVSQSVSNIAAQQKIADGIQNNGLGNAGGTVVGIDLAQQVANRTSIDSDLDQQINALKKLKELLDMGILTQEEFESKKKEIMKL